MLKNCVSLILKAKQNKTKKIEKKKSQLYIGSVLRKLIKSLHKCYLSIMVEWYSG